jgi:hypothetical protein
MAIAIFFIRGEKRESSGFGRLLAKSTLLGLALISIKGDLDLAKI